jgi:hypothetical protein
MAKTPLSTFVALLPSYLPKGGGGEYRISQPVLASYNAEHGTELKRADLPNSQNGAGIAEWLVKKIGNQYQEWGLKTDWGSFDWLALVSLGYMAGWSDKGGAGSLILYMIRNHVPVTLSNAQKLSGAVYTTPALKQTKRYTQSANLASKFLGSYMNQGVKKAKPKKRNLGVIGAAIGVSTSVLTILAFRKRKKGKKGKKGWW